MNSCQSVWEDDETNRKVELHVDYSHDERGVTIYEITPIKVTFLDPTTRCATRSIGVWTKAGRTMLVSQFQRAKRTEALHEEIANIALASAFA